MRFLVISDIHANQTAFETVLQDAAGQWDHILFLGDLVGYGPDPNGCAALLQAQSHTALSGNHDWAALGRIDIDTFNRHARAAIEWTQAALTDETRAFLDPLPSLIEGESFTYAHASPRAPVWEYVSDAATAWENFAEFDTRFCLVGHTHVPVVYVQGASGRVVQHAPDYDKPVDLSAEGRYIINPGSVGQPRDSDPRAAYGILNKDAMTFQHRRVAYDVEEVQNRMIDAALPPPLVARLQYGW